VRPFTTGRNGGKLGPRERHHNSKTRLQAALRCYSDEPRLYKACHPGYGLPAYAVGRTCIVVMNCAHCVRASESQWH
jgi:hypothetical protein